MIRSDKKLKALVSALTFKQLFDHELKNMSKSEQLAARLNNMTQQEWATHCARQLVRMYKS